MRILPLFRSALAYRYPWEHIRTKRHKSSILISWGFQAVFPRHSYKIQETWLEESRVYIENKTFQVITSELVSLPNTLQLNFFLKFFFLRLHTILICNTQIYYTLHLL